MYDPLMTEMMMDLSNGRHEQALRDAEVYRMIRAATLDKPGARARLLLRLGDILISFGQGLKSHYQPAVR
ncbi:MAG: hypothetical protein M3Q29_19250 [Chloroflexota bacterium]|nr:hypothetical protein [Chloroflexota bacterium]